MLTAPHAPLFLRARFRSLAPVSTIMIRYFGRTQDGINYFWPERGLAVSKRLSCSSAKTVRLKLLQRCFLVFGNSVVI